jgi:hypothetical protein
VADVHAVFVRFLQEHAARSKQLQMPLFRSVWGGVGTYRTMVTGAMLFDVHCICLLRGMLGMDCSASTWRSHGGQHHLDAGMLQMRCGSCWLSALSNALQFLCTPASCIKQACV